QGIAAWLAAQHPAARRAPDLEHVGRATAVPSAGRDRYAILLDHEAPQQPHPHSHRSELTTGRRKPASDPPTGRTPWRRRHAIVPSAGVLLELTDVAKRYGQVTALRGLSGPIGVAGRRIGLLGPNGAGKSTLLKLLLGLTPFEGEARVLGLDPRRDALAIRDRVGYMPEMESYLAGMTAVQLCAYAGELSGLPRAAAMERAHAALYLCGLEDKRYLKVETYSTGMKQRVKLAQAVVHDPELLFLDEPTNGLDPAGREEMLALIADLPARRGVGVILSSHLLPDVERVCDEVMVLAAG